MSLFPRFVTNELNSFGPMFRLMDDYANHVMTAPDREGPSAFTGSLTRFQPKFDVTESKDNYELHGELPGIEQKDVNIAFTDPQTLVIKGQTEQVCEQGQPPSGLIEGQAEQNKITEGGEETAKSHQATVEDENAPKDAEKSTESAESSEVTQQHRTFSFPSRVDHDAVKASLKNGILSVVVPKAAAPQTRRINIE
ncbi:hypothetical protein B0A55_00263 [Friedmanniomyces simplex]|uniref:SHSP domain-containing protein n=1 Tax=Friedmanniomyces simplex TaxID=329884 RepID=A0A4U0Y0P0_9PEZI|nr:hypothetical protein B0A55_00263 [Friedmanniomyces simplex]